MLVRAPVLAYSCVRACVRACDTLHGTRYTLHRESCALNPNVAMLHPTGARYMLRATHYRRDRAAKAESRSMKGPSMGYSAKTEAKAHGSPTGLHASSQVFLLVLRLMFMRADARARVHFGIAAKSISLL